MRRGAALTISIHVVRGVFAEAIARGIEPAALAARFGVTPEMLGDADARVGVDVMVRLWTELPRMTGVDDFGLAVARRAQEAGALSVIGYVLQSAPTLGEGLRRALRYQRVMQDVTTTHVHEEGDAVRVVFEARDPAFQAPRHAMEFGLASMMHLARRTTGRDVAPRRIEFRHARPADDREARRVFACEIAYGAPRDAAVMDRAHLDLPQLTADPHLAEMLDRHARAIEAKLPSDGSFAARVRLAMCDLLAGGDTGLDLVATKLRVSTRTAQRRLREEGTSHQRVLDELRHDLALRYLQDASVGIQEVAFLLGFSDQSAFHHAFVRWTGEAPGAWRRRARG